MMCSYIFMMGAVGSISHWVEGRLEEHISSLIAQKSYRISLSENGKRFSIRENT